VLSTQRRSTIRCVQSRPQPNYEKRLSRNDHRHRSAEDATPRGRFEGYGSQNAAVPHEREDGAMLLSFHLKEDVPLRRNLQFIDASQGLCDFDGVSFRGRLLLPNIYEAYNKRPDLIDAPWVESAALVPGCCYTGFAMEVMSPDDVEVMRAVLDPMVESCNEYGLESLGGLELL